MKNYFLGNKIILCEIFFNKKKELPPKKCPVARGLMNQKAKQEPGHRCQVPIVAIKQTYQHHTHSHIEGAFWTVVKKKLPL